MAKNKHLTLDERYKIQHMLDAKKSFASIARSIGKDRSTVSKEIRNHLLFKQTGCLGILFNDCANRTHCSSRLFCKLDCPDCKFGKCSLCIKHCDAYEKELCPRHDKAPYVCNGCSARSRCTLEKRLYSATYAQQEYELVAREVRSGVCITEDEALLLDEIISPLIKQGQSIHHIVQNNAPDIMYSEKTIYNYVDKGVLSVKNIDLPRKVRFKPRKSKHDQIKVDKKCRIGRTYKDFQNYMKEHPGALVIEMDSVIGTSGGKCLLTIHFVNCQFMLAYLRDRNTAASVAKCFDGLYTLFGHDRFTTLFPLILTDNGSEFSDPTAIETDMDGISRTKIFYCDPSSPYQKGAAENNHEFIRRIIPKGKSFNDLTQDDIDLMMDHINSYKRENLAWNSPYEIFRLFYGQNTLDALGANLISPNDITLTPSLLK